MNTDFDAIVVGSGVTGGWAAKELTEKGLKVLVLERGRALEHGKDYVTEHLPPWEIPFGGKPLRELYARDYPVQSQSFAFDETTRHFWMRDADQPYVQASAVQLVPCQRRRWQVAAVVASGLPLERPRFRGQPARRKRHRLAAPLP